MYVVRMEQAMPDRDADTGKYTETYPLADFLDALEDLGGAGDTQEIADAVGCKYRTANMKLHQLEDDGRITVREVGNAYLWQLPDAE